ncbi:hypothetical protein U1Q18_039981 [Sarracenia purpurea var. burkii]
MFERFERVRGELDVGVHGAGSEIHGDEIAVGWGGERRGRVGGLGLEEGGDSVEGKRGEVAAVEGVRVEVEDRFPGSGSGGSYDGFRQAGSDDDEIVMGGLDGWVRQTLVHSGGESDLIGGGQVTFLRSNLTLYE